MSQERSATDLPEGITLLGSEMLTWSDLSGAAGPVRGDIVRLLLHDVPQTRQRALVVGPHEAAVVRDVAQRCPRTDVLVRSWPDAQELRADLPESVHVYCGPLARLPRPDTGYDVVVALDGLDRLHSAEDERPDWRRASGELTRLLAASGELYVALRNEVGVDSLLALSPERSHDDAHWPEGRVHPSKPGGLDELAQFLEADHGLRLVEPWACFGPVAEPRVAVPTRMLDGLRADPRLQHLVGRASAVPSPDAVPAKDPGEVVRTLVAHGLADRLAPQWILHLRPEGADEQPPVTDQILVAEPRGEDRPSAASRIVVRGDTWSRQVVASASAPELAVGVRAETSRLDGEIPRGTGLDSVLATAAAAHDQDAIGELVRSYRRWLGDGPAVPIERVALTFADLARGVDGEVVVIDGRLLAREEAPVEEVLLRCLVVAAEQLLASAVRHPWPASYSPAQVASSMAASAGMEPDAELRARALALDGHLRRAPASPELAGAPPPASWAELNEQVETYRTRLTEAEAQLEWLVHNIHLRQRALRAARGRASAIETSMEYRVGKRVFWFRTFARRARNWWWVKRHGPRHEWRAPGTRVKEQEPIPVEPELLPEGYIPETDEL